MDKDIRAAMLGDHEAAKRLTDAGVLLGCPFCGSKAELRGHTKETPRSEEINEFGVVCTHCGCSKGWFGQVNLYYKSNAKELAEDYKRDARLAWNTRAPILSEREMEMLEGLE